MASPFSRRSSPRKRGHHPHLVPHRLALRMMMLEDEVVAQQVSPFLTRSSPRVRHPPLMMIETAGRLSLTVGQYRLLLGRLVWPQVGTRADEVVVHLKTQGPVVVRVLGVQLMVPLVVPLMMPHHRLARRRSSLAAESHRRMDRNTSEHLLIPRARACGRELEHGPASSRSKRPTLISG